jgi:hypothetical protein
MAVTSDDNPVTDTGVVDEVVEPLPSCPLVLSPQHFAAPATTAHAELLLLPDEYIEPAALETDTAVTPDDKPVTDTGVLDEVVEPLPSCPLSFAPQHFTAPDTTAHADVLLTDIEVTPDDKPVTCTGANDEVVEPLPS